MLRVISLGAGVQSTTMALMAAHGELPTPDCVIFADTGWEPSAVYQHLDRLEKALPFPVYRVSAGNIRQDAISGQSAKAGKFAAIPWFTRNKDGSHGIGKRECTTHYKLEPIRRKIVEFHNGKRPKAGTEMWIGISTNEAFRVRPSRVQYIINRYPLIERNLNRNDCHAWLARHGWNAPKSACIGCPYRSNEQWKLLPPDELQDAIEVDTAIRHQQAHKKIEKYMHASRTPLSTASLSAKQPDLFLNECEGMCGV